jgi:hypothetical protein
VKVIGAGFGRTGTLSLKAALETLGFGPCYHMTDLYSRPCDGRLWEAAARGEPVDWEEIFGDYRATVDWPGCAFYGDLLEAYPHAKVLLAVRDPEEWYESARSTIHAVRRSAYSSAVADLVWKLYPAFRVTDRVIWEGTFGGRFEDKEHAISIFERHNEEVKRRVPPERLLVYEVKQGWEPLCDFLGVEVPAGKPFPRLNDADSFRGRVRAYKLASALALAAPLTGLALHRLRSRRSHTP